jgi:hypothetical protein
LRICAAAYTGFSEVFVKNLELVKRLQAWYSTWCKRPAFSAADEYLHTFNRANVMLVDTDGKGLSGMTATSIVAGKQLYAVDMVIFVIGYRAPVTGMSAQKANIEIIGSNGIPINEEWARKGPSTLHGVMDANS